MDKKEIEAIMPSAFTGKVKIPKIIIVKKTHLFVKYAIV